MGQTHGKSLKDNARDGAGAGTADVAAWVPAEEDGWVPQPRVTKGRRDRGDVTVFAWSSPPGSGDIRVAGGRACWLPPQVVLPPDRASAVTITYDVYPEEDDSECIGAFSANKQLWGQAAPDALTWYCAPHRTDFDFRLDMFGRFMSHHTFERRKKVAAREWHSVRVQLHAGGAQYSVNGQDFAGASFAPSDRVPRRGCVGFVSYATPCRYRNARIEVTASVPPEERSASYGGKVRVNHNSKTAFRVHGTFPAVPTATLRLWAVPAAVTVVASGKDQGWGNTGHSQVGAVRLDRKGHVVKYHALKALTHSEQRVHETLEADHELLKDAAVGDSVAIVAVSAPYPGFSAIVWASVLKVKATAATMAHGPENTEAGAGKSAGAGARAGASGAADKSEADAAHEADGGRRLFLAAMNDSNSGVADGSGSGGHFDKGTGAGAGTGGGGARPAVAWVATLSAALSGDAARSALEGLAETLEVAGPSGASDTNKKEVLAAAHLCIRRFGEAEWRSSGAAGALGRVLKGL